MSAAPSAIRARYARWVDGIQEVAMKDLPAHLAASSELELAAFQVGVVRGMSCVLRDLEARGIPVRALLKASLAAQS